MLVMSDKIITIKGRSMIGDVEAAMFDATLNYANPVSMVTNLSIVNEQDYRDNIVQCRNDENEFRAYAQSLQDDILAETAETSETEV